MARFAEVGKGFAASGKGLVDEEEACSEYSRLYDAHQNKDEKPPYTQAFQFSLPSGDTKGPDTATLSS